MVQEIFIIGSGTHAEVVRASILRIDTYKLVGFVDSRDIEDTEKLGLPLYTNIERFAKLFPGASVIVGIGDNDIRVLIAREAERNGLKLVSIVDPTAIVNDDVVIGRGVYVANGAILNTQSVIGDYAIINTGVIIEHHNRIGIGAHIGPGVTLGGKCKVGQKSFVGLGSTVLQNRTIGYNSIVGAGGVVIDDIGNNVVAVGVPAKVIKPVNNTIELSNVQAFDYYDEEFIDKSDMIDKIQETETQ